MHKLYFRKPEKAQQHFCLPEDGVTKDGEILCLTRKEEMVKSTTYQTQTASEWDTNSFTAFVPPFMSHEW